VNDLECYKVVSRGLKSWFTCSKTCLERSITTPTTLPTDSHWSN